MPRPRFETPCEGVFLYRGAVQVYALPARDRRCVLVDLGGGGVLDHLDEIGCTAVSDVLITHGHRTQLEGVARLAGTGARLHVNPNAPVFRPDAMASCLAGLIPMRDKAVGRYELPMPLPAGVEAAADLTPGARVRAGDVEFQVLDARGHDLEQVALLAEVGGRRVCFGGDAVHSPGKVYELFSTDWDHYTGAGARAAAQALATIRAAGPHAVLASHGPGVREDVADSLLITESLLRAYAALKDHFFLGCERVADLKEGRPRPLGPDGPCRISRHIWALPGNTYVVTGSPAGDHAEASRVSNGDLAFAVRRMPSRPFGRPPGCLLVDACAGDADRTLAQLDRIGRFTRARVPLRPEVILSTQFHLDHLPLASEMAAQYAGAELWAEQHVAHVAERCEQVRRPWLAPCGVRCRRRLAHGETFRWREHSFTAHWMPGQTDGHAGYSARIDGRSVLFTGDNFFLPQCCGGYGGLCGFNGAWDPLSGYGASARQVLDLAPDWLLMEHDMASPFRREWFECGLRWCDQVALLQRALSPGEDRARHCNPYLVAFEPFVMPLRAGVRRVTVHLDNRGADRPRAVVLRARPPAGVRVRPARLELHAPPDALRTAVCELAVGSKAGPGDPLAIVPFDVTIDGERLGLRNAVFLDARLKGGPRGRSAFAVRRKQGLRRETR
jgi:glyoxylase-like metal-dependent hydrolase (beta-lactamase superfamily II)